MALDLGGALARNRSALRSLKAAAEVPIGEQMLSRRSQTLGVMQAMPLVLAEEAESGLSMRGRLLRNSANRLLEDAFDCRRMVGDPLQMVAPRLAMMLCSEQARAQLLGELAGQPSAETAEDRAHYQERLNLTGLQLEAVAAKAAPEPARPDNFTEYYWLRSSELSASVARDVQHNLELTHGWGAQACLLESRAAVLIHLAAFAYQLDGDQERAAGCLSAFWLLGYARVVNYRGELDFLAAGAARIARDLASATGLATSELSFLYRSESGDDFSLGEAQES